jgi:putative membrane protein
MWWHDGGSGWVWMSVMMLAFWTIVVVAVIGVAWASRNPRDGTGSERPATPTPKEILAERYARGEIDSEEYRHRLDEIEMHARR